MRKPIIAANWKMNKTIAEGLSFAANLPKEESLYQAIEVVVCPPFTALGALSKGLKEKGVKLGGQNLYPAEKGAFTGEISPLMLRELGCTYVILGHSERRHLLEEKDSFINEKVKMALEVGLIPILCVGETIKQKQAGETIIVCQEQLWGSLKDIPGDQVAEMVIAYEPVWAIGTGLHALPVDAEATIASLRELIKAHWGAEVAAVVRIQYGGSVKPENIEEFMACPNIDGALVGGASLEADSFYQIIQGAREGSE